MLIILSPDTRKSGSMLSYEISQAVDYYELPLIVAYTGYRVVASPSYLSNRWPNELAVRINNSTAHAIHIPFKKDVILKAIKEFGVNDRSLDGADKVYIRTIYENMGFLKAHEQFSNIVE